jgi:hypothetical protein
MASFVQLNAQAATLLEGKYVVLCKDGETPKFFEIALVKGGNRLYELKGNPGDYTRHTCTKRVQEYVLWKLISAPAHHMALYGQHAKFCGDCNSALTHARSLAAGMGKHCCDKHGVKW